MKNNIHIKSENSVERFALSLANAETEEDVINILQEKGYWDNEAYWRPYGDNENNYSTIGNQQNDSDRALAEKIVNSIDAILMKECLIECGRTDGKSVPQSIQEAMWRYFKIRDGQLSTLDRRTRNDISKNIIVAATGKQRGEMNIIVIDNGEGQTAKRMPDTILSISKKNKQSVPFVQGKFNMGGTGALEFAGKNHLQLVITRRNPNIKNVDNDPTFNNWSVTIVRKERPNNGRRISMYTYLVNPNDNNGLFNFSADKLNLIPKILGNKTGRKSSPGNNDDQDNEDRTIESGTYIKLYNYALQEKTLLTFDFYYKMNLLLPDVALPVRIRECRANFSGNSFEITMNGLLTRMSEDNGENLEDGFPIGERFKIDGQSFSMNIYLFKEGKQKHYRKNEGVLYEINGQTENIENASFFNKAQLSYLKDSLLVLVDCSELDNEHQEDMFMNSRDRIKTNDFTIAVKRHILNILKDNENLKNAQNIRRAQMVKNKLNDDKPLKDVIEKICKKSSVLSKVLLYGQGIKSPFNLEPVSGVQENFIGKKEPTFFHLKGKLAKDNYVKYSPINHNFRVSYETDAANDYFTRKINPVKFNLLLNGQSREDLFISLHPNNGIVTLNVKMPPEAVVGDVLEFKTNIEDMSIYPQTFENVFHIQVTEAQDYDESGGGNRQKPSNPEKKGKEQSPQSAIPNVTEVTKDEWQSYGMDEKSAVVFMETENAEDLYVNMDNIFLLTELKGKTKDKEQVDLCKARYKYGMTLISLSVISYFKNEKSKNLDGNIQDGVKNITEIISPILIPLIESMSQLDMDELSPKSTMVDGSTNLETGDD